MNRSLKEAIKEFLPSEEDREKLSWDSDLGKGFFNVTDPWYEDIYFEASVANSKSKIAVALNKFRVSIVNKYVSGKVLDFGCGCGQFIEYRGDCLGFDICPKAIAELREKGRYLDFWNGGLKDHEIEAVTMFDVLEHIRNPEFVLSQILCKYVFISIPIFNSREDAIKSRHFKPREHFWYFSHESLVSLLDENGFDMVEVRDDETRIGRAEIQTYVFRKRRLKEIGKNCDVCYTTKDYFKPLIDTEYVCSTEMIVFECMDKNSKSDLCFWDNPGFKEKRSWFDSEKED